MNIEPSPPKHVGCALTSAVILDGLKISKGTWLPQPLKSRTSMV